MKLLSFIFVIKLIARTNLFDKIEDIPMSKFRRYKKLTPEVQ